MKRINVQRDVESRRKMEEKLPTANETKTAVEPVTPPTDAQSKEVQEHEVDQIPEPDEKPKKRGRSAKGNI